MFNSLYKQLPDEDNNVKQLDSKDLLYTYYCPKKGEEYGKCNSDIDKVSASFVYLLSQLFGNVESDEEHGDQKDHNVNYVKGDWYEEDKKYGEHKMDLFNKEIDTDLMKDSTRYYQSVKSYAEKFKQFSNHADIDTSYNLYLDVYYMLKNVYNDFINDYYKNNPQNNAPPKLPEIDKINEHSTSNLETSDSQKDTNEKT
ncbi:PIR protein [Plasmodium yoelii yoelii]|uniref:PIR protein n=1 Tax=Plasmodium yoelii yoelii TaxID=73239 RepID=A0AAF0B2P3_PLAYO|nr:PIR protein [Plasmodium yoelii yoelii]